MNSKVKVLHLIKSLGRGGAEKLIPETAKLHDLQRFEFYCIYFYHQENNIVEELRAAGIRVFLFPSSNLGIFRQINKVKNFIKIENIDIIHAHLPWAGVLARLVGRKIKIPIVYTEHNTWDRYNKVSYWFNKLTFKKQDVAIAVSNEVALSMELNMMISPLKRKGRLKVKNILNGVNTDFFKKDEAAGEAIRAELGIPQNAFVIGKVAVFRSQKRLWIWVQQALQILQIEPKVHFLLVGDGDWREKILKQMKESNYASNFHWVGVQKEVIPFLSTMNLYMSSSEFEGLPVAMLEAMSCQIPVVATRAGGIGEAVTHGLEGMLCEVDEYEKLSNLCLRIIQVPELHQALSLNARLRVEKEFSMKKMVSEIEEVYNNLV
ncbi:glycosyltransferase [Belliella baltica DSM 15883]|uniref:Glycosyltransferase n=1 Tax=Belliella baltica (strain DSM 15883 / CIP 108006 / LMG 21964 / BA134) TaxID=866536 RepID=I3Z8W7_BELBD|nr:glycosyltransferase [Belliella baltica]AFL85685.1 glycosyltransferase [Belliella baltica DSM 15883]